MEKETGCVLGAPPQAEVVIPTPQHGYLLHALTLAHVTFIMCVRMCSLLHDCKFFDDREFILFIFVSEVCMLFGTYVFKK